MSSGPAAQTGRIAAQDGTSLFYRCYGDRSAGLHIVCLPGLTRNSHDFQLVAGRLAERHFILCPDYRGRGRSGYCRSTSDYAPPRLVADLADMLTALSLHRVLLIGTSLGGLLALGLAVMHPTTVAGVVLNDIGPDLDPAALAPIGRSLKQAQSPADWGAAASLLQSLLPDVGVPDPKDEGWLKAAQGTWRETDDGTLKFDFDERLISQLDANHPIPNLWPLFRSVRRLPLGVIRGAKSQVLTVDGLARMQDAHPDLVHATIDDVGHTPHLEEPQSREVIDAIIDRVQRIESRAFLDH